MKLFGVKVINWAKIKEIPPAERVDAIVDALCKALGKIQGDPVKKYAAATVDGQKIVGHDANLMPAAPVALVMSDQLKSPDRGYEVLFDEVDMRASSNDTFKIIDVSGGVTFYQQRPGEEAKLSKLPKAAVALVSFLRFTGGFAILDDWLRFNQYYLIDQLFADTTRNWFDKKATIHYGLLTALSSAVNQAFVTDDISTINAACAGILQDLTDAGYAVDENSQFDITVNPTIKERILMALYAGYLNPNTNNKKIIWNIRNVIATSKIVNTSYYVSLPGGKNMRGEWEDFNLRPPQRNELALGADHVWTGAYNPVIGEAKQHKRCALS